MIAVTFSRTYEIEESELPGLDKETDKEEAIKKAEQQFLKDWIHLGVNDDDFSITAD